MNVVLLAFSTLRSTEFSLTLFCKLQLYSPVFLSIRFRLFDLPKFSILLGPLLDPDNVGALHGDRANHLARIGHFSNVLSSAV